MGNFASPACGYSNGGENEYGAVIPESRKPDAALFVVMYCMGPLEGE